jgi:hypothetical protein
VLQAALSGLVAWRGFSRTPQAPPTNVLFTTRRML